MTEGWNNGTTEGQGESSIAPTFSKRGYKYVLIIISNNLAKRLSLHLK